MIQRDGHIQLFGDPDGGHDIICPVAVGLDGDLAADHQFQCLQLQVKGRHFCRVTLGAVLFIRILLGPVQRLPNQGGGGHTGHRLTIGTAKGVFGVLAEGHLHGQRRFQHHLFHGVAPGLHSDELSGNGVGAARASSHCRYTAPDRHAVLRVQRINAINRPDLGRDRVGGLVAVGKADGRLIDTDMAVGINEAGQYIAAPGVQYLGISRVQATAHRGDLAVPDQHLTVLYRALRPHGQDLTVCNEKLFHVITRSSLKIPWPVSPL